MSRVGIRDVASAIFGVVDTCIQERRAAGYDDGISTTIEALVSTSSPLTRHYSEFPLVSVTSVTEQKLNAQLLMDLNQ